MPVSSRLRTRLRIDMQSPGAQRKDLGQSCRKRLRICVAAIIAICGVQVPLSFAQSSITPDRIAEGWLAAINSGNVHWDWSDAKSGLRIQALKATWYNTANGAYFQAIRGAVDAALDHPDQVEDGRIPVATGGPLFHCDHALYMKNTCAISLHGSAQALPRDRGDVVMATAKFGGGTVFAMVDPWLYNEYTDGRKNPAIYKQVDNFAAGKEFVEWLIQQRPRIQNVRRPERSQL